jgi:hypothetical protein
MPSVFFLDIPVESYVSKLLGTVTAFLVVVPIGPSAFGILLVVLENACTR